MRTARPVWHGSRPATSGVPGAHRRRCRTNASRSRVPPRPGSAFVDAACPAHRNQLGHRRGASILPKPGGRISEPSREMSSWSPLQPGRQRGRPASPRDMRAGTRMRCDLSGTAAPSLARATAPCRAFGGIRGNQPHACTTAAGSTRSPRRPDPSGRPRALRRRECAGQSQPARPANRCIAKSMRI